MDKIRVAVIGNGIIGEQHIKRHADNPDVEIVAL